MFVHSNYLHTLLQTRISTNLSNHFFQPFLFIQPTFVFNHSTSLSLHTSIHQFLPPTPIFFSPTIFSTFLFLPLLTTIFFYSFSLLATNQFSQSFFNHFCVPFFSTTYTAIHLFNFQSIAVFFCFPSPPRFFGSDVLSADCPSWRGAM